MKLSFAEPFRIKMVEEIYQSTPEEREKWIEEKDYNLFNLESHKVFIDLLTDSGTGAMSDKQWSEMMTGDESYAGSQSFLKLKETINTITGFKFLLPTHQGRAAENVLFSALVKEGHVVPGNSHFDTTKGHIEFRKAHAIDCTIDEAFDSELIHPFKGNIDLQKLENVYKEYGKEKIPFTLITVTCNSSGGQPVSMENIRQVRELSNQYEIPVFFDGARFAENAYFIKEREEEFKQKTIKEIVLEMFSFGDGMTMSAKKDGLVNIGGFIALNNEELYKICGNFGIIYEGYLSYGGLAGRDLAALAQGLQESTEYSYLQSRIKQIEYLGNKLIEYGFYYEKAKRLGIELYKEAGIRGVEIGTILADRDPETRENRYPKLELLRLAIPRRTYFQSHMDYIAVALKNIFDRRNEINSGYEISWESEILRHFTVKLKKK